MYSPHLGLSAAANARSVRDACAGTPSIRYTLYTLYFTLCEMPLRWHSIRTLQALGAAMLMP